MHSFLSGQSQIPILLVVSDPCLKPIILVQLRLIPHPEPKTCLLWADSENILRGNPYFWHISFLFSPRNNQLPLLLQFLIQKLEYEGGTCGCSDANTTNFLVFTSSTKCISLIPNTQCNGSRFILIQFLLNLKCQKWTLVN